MNELPPQTEIFPQQPQRDLRWVFVGANGIRAGWSALLFALMVVATVILTARVMHHFFHPRQTPEIPVWPALLGEFLQLVGVFAATAIMARIEHRPVFAYGYKGDSRTIRFFSGLVWGFIAISLLFLVLWKAKLLSFDGQMLHGGAIWKYAASWGLLFLVAAFFEDTAMRGYLQYTLTRGIGFWPAALLLSFLFGFAHGVNPGESSVGLFSAGAYGLLACLSLWYTGSLWWMIGFHAAWDWGESYFYGTSDSGLLVRGHLLGEHPRGNLLWSGGASGPEGSLLIFPLIGLAMLLMWMWWRRRGVAAFQGQAWKPVRN